MKLEKIYLRFGHIPQARLNIEMNKLIDLGLVTMKDKEYVLSRRGVARLEGRCYRGYKDGDYGKLR